MTSAAALFDTLCPGCFAEKGSASTCPHCGYDESQKRGPLVLPHRTLLHHGQYLVGKVLGKPGGFGITYLAFDTKLETKVAIKEYLPRDLAGRDGDHATISAHSADDAEHFRYGLTQFLQEARTLARFDHANIVRVRNFFEENGTGYLVMDYYDGITLADYLAQQPQGKLPEQTAIGILMPILDGLREVHAKNFLHRDIKPQNIYLTTGNRAMLLDFGAARQAMSERSRSLSVVLSEGYAPYEQYHRRGEQGPWTDIYAGAAVLYHMVAGEAPPPATERVAKDELGIDALGCSSTLANALQAGLAVDHRKRPQTMAEFQALLLERKTPAQPLDAQTWSAPNIPPVPVTKMPEVQAPTQSKTISNQNYYWPIHWSLAAAFVLIIAVLVSLSPKNEPVKPKPTQRRAVVESEKLEDEAKGKSQAPPVPQQQPIPAKAAQIIDWRYEILAEGTQVRDLKTGLIWQRCEVGKKWNGSTCVGQGGSFTFKSALQRAGNGWHVPDIDQLKTLLTAEKVDGLNINPQAFPNSSSRFWSGSPYASDSNVAWVVYFDIYHTGGVNHNRSLGLAVRLVRGGK
ncbi:MAG: protein kinase [Rhodoferax sp.]|nr:protein kinase [Rhodoferax sp.]